ncbi:MAG: ABC transporter ATP-binding protein [Pseudomonadota bacterium]
MLQVKGLHAYYGQSHILRGVDLRVREKEIVSLLGRNGVGRSTTCKSIMGLVSPQGSVKFRDEELAGLKPFEIARKGIGFVPEDRWIFPGLTVMQNLQLGRKNTSSKGRWSFDQVFELFPRLKERAHVPGGFLSGGEQQMLTICRTLMGDPGLVIIDEPTEGLAPQMVTLVGSLIEEIAQSGIAVLLVEQKLSIALKISSRVYVMGQGRIVFEGVPGDMEGDSPVRKEWLEV